MARVSTTQPNAGFHGAPQKPAASATPTAIPAIFSIGFRPFFVAGALFAGLGVPYWVWIFVGHGAAPPVFTPIAWHAHEMLYGYLAAVVTGFLLTAMPNWTGLPPLRGAPLAALFALWVAGRIAIAMAAHLDARMVAVIDVAFLAVVALVLARDVVRSKSWSNLSSVAVIAVFAGGNALCHWPPAWAADSAMGIGNATGVAAAILLISLVGGRVIPAFTRNWLAAHNPGRLPIQYSRFDSLVLAVGACTLIAWFVAPRASTVTGALALAGVLHGVRLTRWAGDRARREPLVLVLHVGYAFVPLGFLLLAASGVTSAIGESAALHAWTAGAIGVMTVGMMTRVGLGHCGRPLVADRFTQAMYAAVVLAALVRIAAGLLPPMTVALLEIASAAWMLALLGFVVRYGPMLLTPRM